VNLRHLEFLRLIVALGSFERAAEAAQVTQPAVSQAMRALQSDVGRVLFERCGRRMVPTTAALSLARAGEAIRSTVDTLDSGFKAGANDHRGRVLRVGMAPAAGLLYGPRVHASLLDVAPRFVLHLETGAAPRLLSQLLCADLDLAIAPLPRKMRDDRLRLRHLYTSEPLIYCRPGHPMAHATSLEQLKDASWVVAGAAGTPGNVIGEAFRVRRLPIPRIAVRCTDYAMLLRLVSQSDLLGVVSHPALLPPPGLHAVQPLPVLEGLPHYAVCAFWRGGERTTEVARVRDHIVDALSDPSSHTD